MSSVGTARTSGSIHREVVVEEHLVARLVAGQGYEERPAGAFDRASALDRELLLRVVRETQPEAWERLERQYGAGAEAELLRQVERSLKDAGTLATLRRGVTLIPNIRVKLCHFRPASGLNPELERLYAANVLSVMRQVRYSAKDEQKAIDVVLLVNGIPVATIELKNALTGSSFRTAEKQYRVDRPPAGEPLLTFKRGALVHFAADEDYVTMTTRLANGATVFLPFTRGREGGAGNPDMPGEFRIAYLYEDLEAKAVFGREVWLEIIGRFLHLERDEGGRERLIFPRYHQLDAVRRLLAHARAHGPGQHYLIQHSAGSGKSNTIGWLAHRAVTLHDAQDRPVFDTAIVVTDRLVLDSQLQATVTQFEQTPGVVKKIDGTSAQLRAALAGGARIIVTTIQKFGTEHLRTLAGQKGRTFALLIDEAHSSQSGKSAQALTDALTREATSSEDVEDIVLAYQAARGPQPTISYIGLTATPRQVTLERFGVKGPDGLPRPFHLYSMRQAIEEGFILDVLQNYVTYRAYYELEKAIADDPTFKTTKAQRRVARFAHLHPTAIAQKAEVIVEHFRRHVMAELEGRAKAMVVTGSRESALRMYLGVKDYLAEHGYDDVRALVAFSGELKVDGQDWTEAGINGFSEAALRREFDAKDEYRLLIVAEKYQTGFDQPKLVGMYVDRKLAGLQAVQTLSRLNRTAPGKARTFVLDFQNTIEEIQEAFRPFYEQTRLEEPTDLHQIYSLRDRLWALGVFDRQEIDAFAAIFYQPALTSQDRINLEKLIRPAVGRFQALGDEGLEEEFRQLLRSYLRFYAFVAQVVRLEDPELEKLSSYGDWLARLLPDRAVPAEIEITDEMLRLHAFKIARQEAGSASLGEGEGTALKPIREFGASKYTVEEEKSLSEIIRSFNDRHGTQFTEGDFLRFEQVNREILDPEMVAMLRNNPPDVVFNAFSDAFFRGAIRLFQRDSAMKSIVLTDQQAREQAIRHFFGRALREVRESA
jgi:type I restriction enzyme R subunit